MDTRLTMTEKEASEKICCFKTGMCIPDRCMAWVKDIGSKDKGFCFRLKNDSKG